jgi:hypothetical protein
LIGARDQCQASVLWGDTIVEIDSVTPGECSSAPVRDGRIHDTSASGPRGT